MTLRKISAGLAAIALAAFFILVGANLQTIARAATTACQVFNGCTGTTTQVTNGVNYSDGTKITSGTALTFNGTLFEAPALIATASSTLGDGTAAGGLTVSGNSTTTGLAYFATNVGINTLGQAATTRLAITGAAGDTGISVAGVTTGTAVSATALTTGTGFNCTVTSSGKCLTFNTTGGNLSTGAGLNITGTANMTANYTGAFVIINPVRNVSAAATRLHSGNIVTISPTYSTSGASASILQVTGTTTDIVRTLSNASTDAGSSVTVSAPVLSVVNKLTATTNVTDSSNVLFLGQLSTTTTGAALSLVNNGLGPLATFTGSGNFGVGTTTPAATLSVQGNALISGTTFLGGAVTATSTFTSTATAANTFPYASTTVINSTGSAYFATSAGSVGIGTTSPLRKLDVRDGADNQLGLVDANTNKAWALTLVSSGGRFRIVESGSGERLTILSGGNVGIGTTTPEAKLDVAGALDQYAEFGGVQNGRAARIGVDALGNVILESILRGTSGVTKRNLSLNPGGGNVGVGTTTPFAKLSVHALNGETNTTLFAVASSTATATTTLFSVSNTGAITQTGGATSTFSNGINVTSGCFAINNVCVAGSGGSGTVTSIDTTYPIQGGTITTTGTLSLAFGTTTSNTWAGTQTFNNSSTTNATTSVSQYITSLATAAGAFLAIDPNGKVISTTTPAGGAATLTGTTGQTAYFSGTNTAVGTSTIFISTASNVGIGTTSPTAQLVVAQTASTTAATGYVAWFEGLWNTTKKILLRIDQWGHIITTGAAMVDTQISSCSGGTINADDTNGYVDCGVGATSRSITFSHPYPLGSQVVCMFTNGDNNNAVVKVTSVDRTQFTYTSSVSINTFYWHCEAHLP